MRKFLDCAEFCQNKHDKTKGYIFFSRRFKDIFDNTGLCGNIAVKDSTNKWMLLLDFCRLYLFVKAFLMCRGFSTKFTTNRWYFDWFPRNCIVNVISCDLSLHAFLRKFLIPKIQICGNFGNFCRSAWRAFRPLLKQAQEPIWKNKVFETLKTWYTNRFKGFTFWTWNYKINLTTSLWSWLCDDILLT